MNKKAIIIILIIILFYCSIIPSKGFINQRNVNIINNIDPQLSFAAFADTHIGAKYQFPDIITGFEMADYLNRIGEDLVDSTNLLDFTINLGDIINHNTAHVNGVGLPCYVNQYKNNMKSYHISNINLPFHCVLGNHDVNDYEMNKDNPHNLTKSIIDELSMNNPVYSMMRDGILFLIVPELAYISWTHPVEYEWVEYMTSKYPETTTIILCHQAIEDTTGGGNGEYRGKQDMDWWAELFQKNPQIKMWIHGHNHFLSWYVNNRTSGETQTKIWEFGHEMAFSAPYSQLDWGDYHEEDRIVIYNITTDGISTATWENNGCKGHWVSDYKNTWQVPTTYNNNTLDWYAFPMFLQDNETQLTDMKILSANITLQLIGTNPMELFYDSKMESPSGRANETILGFGNDRSGNVEWTNPGMKVFGSTYISFPEKYPSEKKANSHEDGRSGQPYHSFPMGTICAAVPDQTYNFTITGRSISGKGKFTMNISCCDWGTKSQYSKLSGSEIQVFSHTFGPDYETIYGTYTVPNDKNAWFLQGDLYFLNCTEYDISLFSVKRDRNSDTTDNFHLCLSGNWYNASKTLTEDEFENFTVNPVNLSDSDGVMNFTAFIDGNHYGMVNIVYHEPLLFGRNARFRVNNLSKDSFKITLTKTITRNSPVKMALWNSKIFKKHPILTELFSRFIFHGLSGKIIDMLFAKKTSIFKMFPYSTDSMYEKIDIISDDNSGVKNISKNGNIWLSCNCPEKEERYVEIILKQ